MVFCVRKYPLLNGYSTTQANTQAMEDNTAGDTGSRVPCSKSGTVCRYNTLIGRFEATFPLLESCPEHDGIQPSDCNMMTITIHQLNTLWNLVKDPIPIFLAK